MTRETARDHADCLVDQLLREVLGGDRPRDLTQRVMAQAKAYDKTRRWWWAGTAMSMAASVAIIAAVWAAWPKEYPVPVAVAGSYGISGNGLMQRGAVIETGPGENATFTFGGYVRVDVGPETTFTIGGEKFQEKLALDYGSLAVSVDKKIGTFDVAVGEATVHVTGTEFSVKVSDEADETLGTSTRMMAVTVTKGSVFVDGVFENGVETPRTLDASTTAKAATFVLRTDPLHGDTPAPGGGTGNTPLNTTPNNGVPGNVPPAPARPATPLNSRGGRTTTKVTIDANGVRTHTPVGTRGITPVTGTPPAAPAHVPPSVSARDNASSTAGQVASPPPSEASESQAPGAQP